jgi:hypothetical protein
MNIDQLVPWQADFSAKKPLFFPLQHLLPHFAAQQQWPQLNDYQSLLDAWPNEIRTLAGKSIRIAAQDGKPDHFEDTYAPRIYHTGEIQTRLNNWHDFFQFLSWFLFPETKAVINSLHLEPAQQRHGKEEWRGRRTPIENMLSLFDEGGAVVVSSDEDLLQLVRDFRWKELFWQRRQDCLQHLQCFTFGHAMYEKALMPYLGMTANSILIKVDQEFFQASSEQQLQHIDTRLAEIFRQGQQLQKPKDLQPFPILGMPGWDEDNEDESYYDNTNYFRPGRR